MNVNLHRRVALVKPWLELSVVWCERSKRSKMPASTASSNHNHVGVAAVLGNVVLDPADGCLHVNNVVGPHRTRAVKLRQATGRSNKPNKLTST